MKRGLVLAGGGSKGSYEVGFMKALKEHHLSFDVVTGTSIGALNGYMAACEIPIEDMEELWETIDYDHIFKDMPDLDNLSEDFMNESSVAKRFIKGYVQNKGADVTPFYELVKKYFDVERLLRSPVDFGLCTVKYPSFKVCYLTKSQMAKKDIYSYLLASAACFPVFPMVEINDEKYIDGGYADNLPIDLAIEMGCDEVIVVDMHDYGKDPVHPSYLNRPHILYTRPYNELGTFMNFDKEMMRRNKRIGYLTACKALGQYTGKRYTFKKHQDPLFEEFYRLILLLEKDARTFLNAEATYFTDVLQEANYHQILGLNDYTYLTLDIIGQLLGFDDLKVYSLRPFLDQAVTELQEFSDQNVFTGKFSADMMTMLKGFNRRNVMGYIYHTLLYPADGLFDLKTYLNLAPEELLAAELLYVHTRRLR